MSRTAVYRTDRELRNYRRKVKRQREIMRNIILAVASALILVLLALSYHSMISFASTDTEHISYKYFTSIRIEKGDTLWDIAEEYADAEYYDSKKEYIDEVMNMNHLKSDEIVTGQYLIIPYYSREFVMR